MPSKQKSIAKSSQPEAGAMAIIGLIYFSLNNTILIISIYGSTCFEINFCFSISTLGIYSARSAIL